MAYMRNQSLYYSIVRDLKSLSFQGMLFAHTVTKMKNKHMLELDLIATILNKYSKFCIFNLIINSISRHCE